MSERAVATQPKASSDQIAHRNAVLQRRCGCGTHTFNGGECAECSRKQTGLQRKLMIGASDDPFELEADRVAEQVLAMPAHSDPSGVIQRIRRSTGQSAGAEAAAPASVDRVLSGSGRPLEPALRQDMEQRFGCDFSQVRVHADAAAGQSARDVDAQAYTLGHDIVFGAGRYAPETFAGRGLIAHELTHVVQQANSFAGVVQRQPSQPDEIEMPEEWAFAVDARKRTWRRYARALGKQDAARIRRRGALSSEDRREVNAKLGFFEGAAKAAYLEEVRPALLDVTREEIEMPAEYAGEADRPVDVLEAIVHIMAGNQVSGDYGPNGENLMHPKYYTDVRKNITKKEYIELLWEWFQITNGTVTDKRGVQFIVQGSMAREHIPRAVADTDRIIAQVGAKEGARWVARYRAKVKEFTQRAVREEVDEMIEAGVGKEREPRSNPAAMSEDEQVKGVAVRAAVELQQIAALFRRALASENADRVNLRVNERVADKVWRPLLREYLQKTFKEGLFVDAPGPRPIERVSNMSLPDAISWLKGGLDAASAILTLTDPAARRQLFDARSSYFGTVAQGLEINQLLWKFVSGSVAFYGAGTYAVARVLGKTELAAQVLDVSTKWIGNVSGALFLVGTVHGIAVLLDPDATSNEKAAAAVEATSSALGVASFASRWTPKLAAAGRWGGPIGISLTLNFWQFSKLADLAAGARIGLARLDWVSCFKATRASAEDTQKWMRKLAVANILIAHETDDARMSELRKVAGIYRTEMMEGHIKPYLADRLRSASDPADCGPALANRFRPMLPVLDGTVEGDDAALGAGAMFLNLAYTALKEWDAIVASSIKK